MTDVRHSSKETFRLFEQTVEQLLALDAGDYADDPDRPMLNFNSMMDDATRGPIESDAQLRIVFGGLDYLLKTEVGPSQGSLDELMDSALAEAIAEVSSTRQWALLALARHRLRGHSIDPLNA